jgi:hypothetical protein
MSGITYARARRPIRPDRRHGPRMSPDRRAVRRDARTHALGASPIAAVRAAAARSAYTTATAAVMAATSSGVASPEITWSGGEPGMG